MAHNDRALCRCGIRIPSAQNHCPAFDKDKYLEPMFGDVGQARTNAAILLMLIATTSSRICTKPIVVCRFILATTLFHLSNFQYYGLNICQTLRQIFLHIVHTQKIQIFQLPSPWLLLKGLCQPYYNTVVPYQE